MNNYKNTYKEEDRKRRQRKNTHIARRILAVMGTIALAMLAGATFHWAVNLAIVVSMFVWAMYYYDAVEEKEPEAGE